MKIGVFLTKRKPQEGGGYTITEEIIKFFSKFNKF